MSYRRNSLRKVKNATALMFTGGGVTTAQVDRMYEFRVITTAQYNLLQRVLKVKRVVTLDDLNKAREQRRADVIDRRATDVVKEGGGWEHAF